MSGNDGAYAATRFSLRFSLYNPTAEQVVAYPLSGPINLRMRYAMSSTILRDPTRLCCYQTPREALIEATMPIGHIPYQPTRVLRNAQYRHSVCCSRPTCALRCPVLAYSVCCYQTVQCTELIQRVLLLCKWNPMQCSVLTQCMVLGFCYAMSGTDLAYAATRLGRASYCRRQSTAGTNTYAYGPMDIHTHMML
eukprot:3941737-Rhodomonas_salina.12